MTDTAAINLREKRDGTAHCVEATYETTGYLDAVTASIEVRVHYTYSPGSPARIRFDEHDHPAEDAEIEIVKIEEEAGGRGNWTEIRGGDFYDRLYDWATMDLMDQMAEEAELYLRRGPDD